MARSFTEQEKENIRKSLKNACKQSWTKYGYKKTNIDELCRQAGISKGAFYIFFESKEDLFCEVLCAVQKQIYNEVSEIMEQQKNKYGVAKALKFVYQQYDKNNFLYDSDSADFTILKNRLSKEQAKKLEESNRMSQTIFYDPPYSKFKIEPEMAISIIYSLIMNVKNKSVLSYDHKAIFDYMVDHLIDNLYE